MNKKVGEWTPIIRGTKEWEDQEDDRKRSGCICLSFGSISLAVANNSKYSSYRMD